MDKDNLKNILIAGASGCIGRNLLLKFGKKIPICAIYNSSEDFERWIQENNLNLVKPIKLDLSDSKKTKEILAGKYFSIVINLASSTSTQDDDINGNKKNIADVTKNLVENSDARSIIHFSSTAVYGHIEGDVDERTTPNPKIPYAENKLIAEDFVKKAWLKGNFAYYYIVRLNGTYGPYESKRKLTYRFLKEAVMENKKNLDLYGDGKNYVDYMYVDDVVEAIKKVIEHSEKAEVGVYILGKKEPKTIHDTVLEMMDIFKKQKVRLSYSGTTKEPTMFFPNTSKFNNTFSFEPKTTFKEGMKNYLKFLRKETKVRK